MSTPTIRTRFPALSLPLIFAALLALSAGPARAEQMERFGDLEVHYIALNTTTLAPEMAERYGLPRADNQALVNISGRRVQADGTTTPVALSLAGEVKNLLGQSAPLDFREVREPGAIYYLATLTFSDRDTLRFDLSVTDQDTGRTHPLQFHKQLWKQ